MAAAPDSFDSTRLHILCPPKVSSDAEASLLNLCARWRATHQLLDPTKYRTRSIAHTLHPWQCGRQFRRHCQRLRRAARNERSPQKLQVVLWPLHWHIRARTNARVSVAVNKVLHN